MTEDAPRVIFAGSTFPTEKRRMTQELTAGSKPIASALCIGVVIHVLISSRRVKSLIL
jgi:hypothetical protein